MNETEQTAATGDQRRLRALTEMNLPRYVLLPGDPNRVDLMASQWTDAEVKQLPRGYRAAVGTYCGVRLAAVSTGIGAPSLEGVFTDLARVGVDTFIRVGTTGTLRAEIQTGSLIINDASVRLDGLSNLYVRPEFPAAASYEVTFALVDAAVVAGFSHRVGTGATAGSFLAGQGRPAFKDFISLEGEKTLEEMKRAGVLNFEMETASLFTLSRIYGLRAGSICSVIANRITGTWSESGGVERACLVGAEAIKRLTVWDAKAASSGLATFASNTVTGN
jgi:uridine phosphorylase